MPGLEKLWFIEAENLIRQADQTVAAALRLAGWRHTSQTPCSIWMWQKEIDGRLYSVSQGDVCGKGGCPMGGDF